MIEQVRMRDPDSFNDLEIERKLDWKTRQRIIDEEGRVGEWSEWTDVTSSFSVEDFKTKYEFYLGNAEWNNVETYRNLDLSTVIRGWAVTDDKVQVLVHIEKP